MIMVCARKMLSDADWNIFTQELNKIIQRQGGSVNSTGQRTQDINLPTQNPSIPLGGQAAAPNMPPSIPLNPSDSMTESSSATNRDDIISAIRAQYPGVTEEDLTEDYLKQVAEALGYSY